jgi:hypothetical protein
MQGPDPRWAREAEMWMATGSLLESDSVTILPTRVESGVAVFSDQVVTIVKDLRSAGLKAQYLSCPGGRQFESTYTDLAAVVAAFLFSVSTNAAWDVCKATFTYLRAQLAGQITAQAKATVRVSTVMLPDGARASWMEMTGPAGRVIDQAEAVVRAQIAALTNSHKESDQPTERSR